MTDQQELEKKEYVSIFERWNKQHSYEDLIEPLLKIFKEYFKTSKKYSEGINYKGLPLFGEVCATCYDLIEKFSKEGIKREKEQERDLRDIILHTAFLYGYSSRDFKYHTDDKKVIDLFNTAFSEVSNKCKTVTNELENLKKENKILLKENNKLKKKLEKSKKGV